MNNTPTEQQPIATEMTSDHPQAHLYAKFIGTSNPPYLLPNGFIGFKESTGPPSTFYTPDDGASLINQCIDYLLKIGFKKLDKADSHFYVYEPLLGDHNYGIHLFECKEGDDSSLDGFKYKDEAGDVIYSCELWNKNGTDEDDSTEISGMTIKNINQLKFIVEGTRTWRRMQLPTILPQK